MDMSKYKQLFISETSEHLQSLNQELVNLEQNPENADAIAEAFRNAHSIKGMAASMGYEVIRDLAHAIEDLMDDFREGLRKPDSEAMDLLFKGLDTLESLLQDVANDRELSPAGLELANRIRAFRGEKTENQETLPSSAPSASSPQQEHQEQIGKPIPGEEQTAGDLKEKPREEGESAEKKTRAFRRLEDEAELVFDFEPRRFGRKKPEPLESGKEAEAEEPSRLEEESAPSPPGPEKPEHEIITPPEQPSPPEEAIAPPSEPEAGPVKPEDRPRTPVPQPPAPATANKTIKVVFSAQTASPGVRGLILFKRLSEAGQVVESRPPLAEVKAGNFMSHPRGLCVEVDLAAEVEDEELIKIINSMTDIQEFEISETKPPAAPRPEEEPALPEPPREAPSQPAYDPFAQTSGLPQTVRVKTSDLDKFISSLGEMLLVKSELREVVKKHPIPALARGLDKLDNIVRDFHDQVMRVRMMPLESVVARLPRVVRDLAREEGKKVKFEVKGKEIELDRAILERLTDPLIHLLRNCVNHGIEPPEERARAGKPPEGTIELEAYRLRDLVLIEVRDDGRGMDPFALKETAVAKGILSAEQAESLSDEEAYQLIFTPGFSTARTVGMVSGRGVGMDAVKNTVESLGGYVTVSTRVGEGTVFTLHLPRTIAIVNVLLVRVGGKVFALPLGKILKTVEILPHQVKKSQGQKFYVERQELIPLRPLHRFLDLPEPEDRGRGPWPAILLELNQRKNAFLVDELVGQEEAFIRPLGKPLEKIAGLSGVTMLGDGRVVFVLDTMNLM